MSAATKYTHHGQPIRILLVEDDDIDARAVQRAFKHVGMPHEMFRARDGEEALNVLNDGDGNALQLPYLVLLDLNLPRVNGFEVLKALRSDPKLRHMVVFVWSTSDAPDDLQLAYELGVAGYIVKSHAAQRIGDFATMLERYWQLVEVSPLFRPMVVA